MDINVIKLDALDEDLLVDENEAIEITGITQSIISAIGAVNIGLIKTKVTFPVVHSDPFRYEPGLHELFQ